jgi:hypothetical protein
MLRYDNLQKDRTESGMMDGVRRSAVRAESISVQMWVGRSW